MLTTVVVQVTSNPAPVGNAGGLHALTATEVVGAEALGAVADLSDLLGVAEEAVGIVGTGAAVTHGTSGWAG
ncbi:MAG TPA: hypothetical protein VHT75_12940 [Acidimicrobiales bacterium]|nr:hypothetical protein [Acidimicrobiales bacterium]